ncbi:MAG: nucleotidyltransferase domain-containing protein [Mycoplasma sp.]|nr:nucleotidyltransferase domain-containing protein [Candidatus Hennigella equi]
MKLRELRKIKGLTQKQAAEYLGISNRTYQYYEYDVRKQTGLRFEYLINRLQQYGYIDENKGILSIDRIKKICLDVFSKYKVDYCYLFGSYAKGNAKDNSDVDLLISTKLNGLKFFGLVEELRTQLRKKVDVLNQMQLNNNTKLVNEILKDGIKIYG